MPEAGIVVLVYITHHLAIYKYQIGGTVSSVGYTILYSSRL